MSHSLKDQGAESANNTRDANVSFSLAPSSQGRPGMDGYSQPRFSRVGQILGQTRKLYSSTCSRFPFCPMVPQQGETHSTENFHTRGRTAVRFRPLALQDKLKPPEHSASSPHLPMILSLGWIKKSLEDFCQLEHSPPPQPSTLLQTYFY